MTKIDKKIIENIELLSKTMIKNNLSEVEVSDGNFSYKLKKSSKDNNGYKITEVSKESMKKKDEPSLLEKALNLHL